MTKIIVFESVTLDGVMQAPGRPDEDRRGGFEHGGWAAPYANEETGRMATEGMETTGALLFGRRTYEDFYGFWPRQPEPNPFTSILNNTKKYVASTRLEEPLPWSNSVMLKGDVPAAVAALRADPGKDIVVLGSGQLVQTLASHNLVDEYVLLVHPLVLGSGRRLFAEGLPTTAMRLVDSKTTSTGVVIATYQPATIAANETREPTGS